MYPADLNLLFPNDCFERKSWTCCKFFRHEEQAISYRQCKNVVPAGDLYLRGIRDAVSVY